MRHGLGLQTPREAPLVVFVGHAPLTVARMVQGGGSAKKAISSKASAVGQVTPTACSAHSTPPHAARVTEGAHGNRAWHTRRRVRAHTAHADHRCRIDTRGHSGGRPDLPGRWTTGRRRPSRRSRDCRRSHPVAPLGGHASASQTRHRTRCIQGALSVLEYLRVGIAPGHGAWVVLQEMMGAMDTVGVMDSISGKNVGRIIGMQVWSAPAGYALPV
jgi:hypothetical protein